MEIGKILEDGTVQKGYTAQGFVYKNDENFENKSGICYISEYSTNNINEEPESCETYESIIEQVEEAYKIYHVNPAAYPVEKLAAVVFEMVDWQGFGTLLYEVIDCLDDDCFL